MNPEKFNDLLKKYQPDLFNKVSAEQSGLSEKILSLRIDSGFDILKMAKLLDLSQEDYLKYEFGDLDFSIEEYKKVIAKMKIFTSKNILLNISSVLNEYLESDIKNISSKSFDSITIEVQIDIETDEFQVRIPQKKEVFNVDVRQIKTKRPFVTNIREITSNLFKQEEVVLPDRKKFKELEVVTL
ncbi:hypothetical protein I6N95_04930 [Vagococcus sp. BWB3-3]|uniref:Uncharacterized protein n=1 Tax=Vagococcus allomyrinae TaxID=2794353 RepID=A0A940PAA9_9ENTE|nr:hypothetical protein [Vagococcus allomyrinae]MBP1040353.1 hypothetical protein [Vagococcus allomyrinae]